MVLVTLSSWVGDAARPVVGGGDPGRPPRTASLDGTNEWAQRIAWSSSCGRTRASLLLQVELQTGTDSLLVPRCSFMGDPRQREVGR